MSFLEYREEINQEINSLNNWLDKIHFFKASISARVRLHNGIRYHLEGNGYYYRLDWVDEDRYGLEVTFLNGDIEFRSFTCLTGQSVKDFLKILEL